MTRFCGTGKVSQTAVADGTGPAATARDMDGEDELIVPHDEQRVERGRGRGRGQGSVQGVACLHESVEQTSQ